MEKYNLMSQTRAAKQLQTTNKLHLAIFSMATLMLFAGCTPLIPSYVRPVADVPASFDSPPTEPGARVDSQKIDASQKSAPKDTSIAKDNGSPPSTLQRSALHWSEYISDVSLRNVIELALKNNRDLRIAALQIEKSQAQLGLAQADLFPRINASISNTASKTPANLAVTGQVTILHDYSAGLGFSSYELDMFGRLQSLRASSFEQYLSTSQAAQSVLISLVAQVANQYLTLSADQAHLELSQQTLETQLKSYAIDEKRFALGVISQLDLSQSRTAIENARVDIAHYKSQVSQDLHLLNLLVGKPVPEAWLPKDFLSQNSITDIQAGFTSDMLRNRPDIAEAEHLLIASNANIGAARAAFFPSITLTTFYGSATPQLTNLFGSGSRAWQFIPQVNLPIFDGGRLSANLSIAKTNQKIALEVYQKTIQTAFREVSDALTVQANILNELSAEKSLVEATELSLKLSTARYQNGINSYLNVLDSERSMYAAKHNLIALKLAQASNQFTLYKALGCGVDAGNKLPKVD